MGEIFLDSIDLSFPKEFERGISMGPVEFISIIATFLSYAQNVAYNI